MRRKNENWSSSQHNSRQHYDQGHWNVIIFGPFIILQYSFFNTGSCQVLFRKIKVRPRLIGLTYNGDPDTSFDTIIFFILTDQLDRPLNNRIKVVFESGCGGKDRRSQKFTMHIPTPLRRTLNPWGTGHRQLLIAKGWDTSGTSWSGCIWYH